MDTDQLLHYLQNCLAFYDQLLMHPVLDLRNRPLQEADQQLLELLCTEKVDVTAVIKYLEDTGRFASQHIRSRSLNLNPALYEVRRRARLNHWWPKMFPL